MIDLVFSGLAEQDLEEIWLFIARDNPARAVSFVQELRNKCRNLRYFPASAPERPELGAGVRMASFGRYIILYEQNDIVSRLRVLHGARRRDTMGAQI